MVNKRAGSVGAKPVGATRGRVVKASASKKSSSRLEGALQGHSRGLELSQVHALDITPQLEQIGVTAALVKDDWAARSDLQVKMLDLQDETAGAVVGKTEAWFRVIGGRVFISFSDVDTLPEQEDVTPAPRISRAQAATGTAELDEALWGSAPTNVEILEASMQTKDRAFAARREVLDNSVSRAKAAEWLAVSEPTISDRIADQSLVAIKDGREWRLPIWQFDPDTERGFYAGLDRLQHEFPGNAVSLSMWVLTENADLGGPPIAALSESRLDDVIHAAKVLRATT